MKIKYAVACGAISLLMAVPLFAQGKGGKPGGGGGGGGETTAKGANIRDAANGYGLYIASDGAGAYSFSIDTTAGVSGSDIVMGAGLYGGSRKAHFTFAESWDWGGENSAPFAEAVIPGHFVLKCTRRGVDVRTMSAGATALCPLVSQFDYNGVPYRLGTNADSQHEVPLQGEDAEVQCTATDRKGCKSWQIRASGAPTYVGSDPNPKSLSILFNRNTNEVLGYYRMSFLIDVVK